MGNKKTGYKYLAVAPPQYGALLTWNTELLDRAVRYWQISGSPFPPSIDEIMYRDMDWDDACYEYRYAVDFVEDEKEAKNEGLI